MRFCKSVLGSLLVLTLVPLPALSQNPSAGANESALEEITVTARKREESLQDSALSVMALTGETLEKDRNLSFIDLARSITGFSYTGNGLFDQELNIRGITTVRVDSPSSNPSVGVFVDGVYGGRNGLMNADFYDIQRVEVIRGPQGVLLGKNVVGGAMSVISKAPEDETSGSVTLGFGDFDAIHATGYLTGALGDNGWSGRLAFQHRLHDGYARDILNNRDMEDLDSTQFRAQLRYDNGGNFTARLIAEMFDDSTNGPASIILDSEHVDFVLGTPHLDSRVQFFQTLGRPLSNRETSPFNTTYTGDSAPTPTTSEREGLSFIADLEWSLNDNLTLNSITGFRDAEGFNLYDQTGISVEALLAIGVDIANINPFVFRQPVNELEDIKQISQELRLSYSNPDSGLDWIIGAYYQDDDVSKYDRFQASTQLLGVLKGEVHWDNNANIQSTALFAQLGYQFNEQWKLTVGGRYTRDDKDGRVAAIEVASGDIFTPGNTDPMVPLVQSGGFSTNYAGDWSEFTPQATLEFQLNDDVFTYLSYSEGFKGGGWEDTPGQQTATQSSAAFNPEYVDAIELGIKSEFWDNRARLNVAIFDMDYDDLQVTQTSDQCNCNITDNAGAADITGAEIEFTVAATDSVLLWINGSVLDTEYKGFVDELGNDHSGNTLQRTPESQYNIGAEFTTGLGQWEDALSFRLNYSHQDKLYWRPHNLESEDAYGLLDARVTLAPLESNWVLSLWGKNLTDEEYRNHVIPFWGQDVSFFAPPRTYGVEFTYGF